MRAIPEKCDLPEKNAFNASIRFQKFSECKKCFFNAGTIARCLVGSQHRNLTQVISSHLSNRNTFVTE